MTKGQNSTAKGVRLSDESWDWLINEGKRRGKTPNEIIKGLIEWYIPKVEERRKRVD